MFKKYFGLQTESDAGRRLSKCKTAMAQDAENRSRKTELVIVSEYLRLRLHCGQPLMIKDRRYHARLYQKCFVGRELVDWLIEHLEASNRSVAVECMRALQDTGLIHHGIVCCYVYNQNLIRLCCK